MIFVQGHKSGMDDAALAVASQHIAQQSCGVVAYDTYVGMFFTENCKDMTEDFAAAVA